jgi:hypothetical protein
MDANKRGHFQVYLNIQNIPGGKMSILGGLSFYHSKQKLYMCPIPNGILDRVISLYRQHALSSHELQSAFMLTVEFSKMYYTR